MVEFLKKLGVPALIAGIVGAMVTIVPILFKVDERYAKEQQLTTEVVRLESQINDLSIEVGKLAGSTQVLVAVMSRKALVEELDRKEIEKAQAKAQTEGRTSVTVRANVVQVPEAPPSAEQVAKVLQNGGDLAKILPASNSGKDDAISKLADVEQSLKRTQTRITEMQQSQQIKK